ncbi:MAG: STAS domain-containing protein [Bacteroidales bacterium]|nr:STAS domain-containing protein [Bacteroidales bacterium]
MDITITQNDNLVTVNIEGRLDTVTAPELENGLASYLDGSTDLTLDCGKMEYVSSAGLRVILTLHKALASKGRKFSLKDLNKDVRNVFDMTGFSRILTIE